ncbi:MAG: helix-turn-helix transcriptional regulator [Peptoniphilaceae bacterium]|nr:helix-turn-helix transcriptional regulator [Peptoniphilaceae bacterium]MDY5765917.1 helix-turn-helix transcriptional regulator [Peptoniphilaceae bacterium]
MNERVKEIRQALELSGAKFGEALGVSRMAISLIETGKNNLTEAMLLAICREYGVNENWLRTGEGEMFRSTDELSLDEMADAAHADPLEIQIVKAYFSIDPEIRKQALAQFQSTLSDQK